MIFNASLLKPVNRLPFYLQAVIFAITISTNIPDYD